METTIFNGSGRLEHLKLVVSGDVAEWPQRLTLRR